MTERKFIVNGLTLNCVDYGSEGKPPILFIHGGSAHGHWWDFVGPHFTDRFHALAIDLRGHGDSEWPAEWEYGTRHYIADLDDLIDNWGLGAPVLVGHSMGGHNVMVYASRHPEKLRAMVAIDSPADYPERAVGCLRGFSERPGKRFKSLEEAMANFRMLPRETLATKEVLRMPRVTPFARRRKASGFTKSIVAPRFASPSTSVRAWQKSHAPRFTLKS